MDPLALLRAALLIVAGYLIGGIPWSVIVARLTGRPDPRTIGSGRTGARSISTPTSPPCAGAWMS